MNLLDLFDETARRQPDAPALVDLQAEGPRTVSYGELRRRIAVVAERLAGSGVGRGDCVGLHLPGGHDYIVHNYAVWQCGGCVVPIPVELSDAEKQELCESVRMEFLISRLGVGRTLQQERAESRAVTWSAPEGSAVVARVESPCEHPERFRRINAAFIRFTSGTTGTSKGVVLSHETIFDRILAANEVLAIGPDDRVVWVLSMSYHFAVSIVGYLTCGAAILLPRNPLADGLLDAAGRHRGTFLYASPLHYALMAEAPSAPELKHLRLAVSTTASLQRDVAKKFLDRFGIPIGQALGIIEVGLPCINTKFAAERPDSVGSVLPSYEVRLEEIGLGEQLRAVSFRGPGFLDAYYRPWRERDEIMPDGWFRTGDVGSLDAGGCLTLHGRSTDVINVMGMKFFPQEVERVLLRHPAVKEAAVFAVPDRRLGELPVAHVALAVEEDDRVQRELREFCRQQLAPFKVPQRIEIVSAVRRTASGKVLHRRAVPAVGDDFSASVSAAAR